MYCVLFFSVLFLFISNIHGFTKPIKGVGVRIHSPILLTKNSISKAGLHSSWSIAGKEINTPLRRHKLSLYRFNLESIATSRAVMSSLTTRFQQEFVSDNTIMYEVIHHKVNYQLDLFYTGLFVLSIYFRIYYVSKFDKLEKFEFFANTRRVTNMIAIFITVVFIKNVDYAM